MFFQICSHVDSSDCMLNIMSPNFLPMVLAAVSTGLTKAWMREMRLLMFSITFCE